MAPGELARLVALLCGATACSALVSLDDLRQPDASAGDAPNDNASDTTTNDGPSNTIAFVQVQYGVWSSGGQSFSMSVGEGHAVIVVVSNANPGAVTVTDTMSNTYVSILNGPYSATDGGTLQLFAALNVKGGFTAIKISPPDGGTGTRFYAAEYAGITAFDKTATGSSQSTGTDGLATSSIVTTATPTLLFAYAEGLQDVSPGTGFTERSSFDSNVLEERIVTTPNSYTATATLSGGTGDILLASFH